MPLWQIALDLLGGLLLLVAVVLAALIVRRRWLTKAEPTFDMSVRTHPHPDAKGWTLGVARYRGDRLEWFRVFSLSLRPKRVFERHSFELRGRREPTAAEAYALFTGHLVVDSMANGTHVQVALGPEALTGLLAWLEAAPPGPGRLG